MPLLQKTIDCPCCGQPFEIEFDPKDPRTTLDWAYQCKCEEFLQSLPSELAPYDYYLDALCEQIEGMED